MVERDLRRRKDSTIGVIVEGGDFQDVNVVVRVHVGALNDGPGERPWHVPAPGEERWHVCKIESPVTVHGDDSRFGPCESQLRYGTAQMLRSPLHDMRFDESAERRCFRVFAARVRRSANDRTRNRHTASVMRSTAIASTMTMATNTELFFKALVVIPMSNGLAAGASQATSQYISELRQLTPRRDAATGVQSNRVRSVG